MTPSLSDTFEPPSTTTYGLSGSTVRRRSTSISVATSCPIACGSRSATSYTLACLRCTTPKPSLTKASASAASWSANAPRSASSLLVSPALNRRFSSNATSPSARPSTVDRALSPTVSSAKATGAPSSSDSRAATGAREYLASGAPFGRPRCAQTTTRAPASRSRWIVGTDARIRPSSVMVVPSSGTLRSLRTSTRLPRRFPRSSRVSTPRLQAGADVGDQVDEAVRVAPLVVVPADDLDLVATDLGQARVEDAGRRVGHDVGGDDLVLGVPEVTLHRALGSRLHGSVDLVHRGLAGQVHGEVGRRAGGDRHPQRVAVQLALELGEHQADRLGCAGRRRHDVQRGGAGTAQVLVRAVLQVLVLRVRVDGRHQAALDGERVVDGLGHRREAVRGARGVRDNRVRLGVVLLVVHAHDHGEVLVLRRGGDEHLLGAAVDVRAGLRGVGEQAGRLDDDVCAEVAPRQLGRVPLLERLDALAAHGDVLLGV